MAQGERLVRAVKLDVDAVMVLRWHTLLKKTRYPIKSSSVMLSVDYMCQPDFDCTYVCTPIQLKRRHPLANPHHLCYVSTVGSQTAIYT